MAKYCKEYICIMTYQEYAMNDCCGLPVGRLTAWDRPMSVPGTCSPKGGVVTKLVSEPGFR